MTDLSDPKKNAALLKQILLENYDVNLPYTSCLQIISKLDGHKNWQTYSACLPKKERREGGSIKF